MIFHEITHTYTHSRCQRRERISFAPKNLSSGTTKQMVGHPSAIQLFPSCNEKAGWSFVRVGRSVRCEQQRSSRKKHALKQANYRERFYFLPSQRPIKTKKKKKKKRKKKEREKENGKSNVCKWGQRILTNLMSSRIWCEWRATIERRGRGDRFEKKKRKKEKEKFQVRPDRSGKMEKRLTRNEARGSSTGLSQTEQKCGIRCRVCERNFPFER